MTMQQEPESIGDISQRLRGTKPGPGEVAATRERTGTKAKDQLALDEVVIDDPSVIAALDELQKHKDARSAIGKLFKAAKLIADGKIAELELHEGGAVRCGRFRITKSAIAGKVVSFETEPSSRVRISLIKEG